MLSNCRGISAIRANIRENFDENYQMMITCQRNENYTKVNDFFLNECSQNDTKRLNILT